VADVSASFGLPSAFTRLFEVAEDFLGARDHPGRPVPASRATWMP